MLLESLRIISHIPLYFYYRVITNNRWPISVFAVLSFFSMVIYCNFVIFYFYSVENQTSSIKWFIELHKLIITSDIYSQDWDTSKNRICQGCAQPIIHKSTSIEIDKMFFHSVHCFKIRATSPPLIVQRAMVRGKSYEVQELRRLCKVRYFTHIPTLTHIFITVLVSSSPNYVSV